MDNMISDKVIKSRNFIEKMLDGLSMQVNGCQFDQAPTDWQRMVEQMVKRGITFNIGETK